VLPLINFAYYLSPSTILSCITNHLSIIYRPSPTITYSTPSASTKRKFRLDENKPQENKRRLAWSVRLPPTKSSLSSTTSPSLTHHYVLVQLIE
jgi:hypothetical protein